MKRLAAIFVVAAAFSGAAPVAATAAPLGGGGGEGHVLCTALPVQLMLMPYC